MNNALDSSTIGKIVTLFAMDSVREHYSDFLLKVLHPEAFQEICWQACKDAPNAYFDDGDIYGWIRSFDQVGNKFTLELLPEIHPDDIESVKYWFRNFSCGRQQQCPVKRIWLDAFRWAWKLDKPPTGISNRELELIKEFWKPVKEAVFSDEIEEVKDEIADDGTSKRDEAIKVKFHLNPIGDRDYFFQDLHFMREGHLLVDRWREIEPASALAVALQKLPYAWWDENPDRRKYLDFDIRAQREMLVGELIK